MTFLSFSVELFIPLLDLMPYRILCNGVKREGVKASPDLAFGLFYFVPLHKIRYGIWIFLPNLLRLMEVFESSRL